jgi:hypothetical protein
MTARRDDRVLVSGRSQYARGMAMLVLGRKKSSSMGWKSIMSESRWMTRSYWTTPKA